MVYINYNLRSQTNFGSNGINPNDFGLNFLRYFASKIWSMVLLEIKNSANVKIFKAKIGNWEPNDCLMTVTVTYVCKTYINNLGFVNVM